MKPASAQNVKFQYCWCKTTRSNEPPSCSPAPNDKGYDRTISALTDSQFPENYTDEVHRCVSPSDSDSDSSSSGYSSSQPQAFHIPVIRFRSPLEWLDEKRLTEYDFHQNGIECDLDEIDIYLAIRRRCSKLAVQEFPRDVDLVSPTGTPNPVRHEARRDNVFVNQDHDVGLHARRRSRHVNPVCVFCKNNGEPLSVYGGHVLKDDEGRCACPVLRRYTCPKCGANGDSAHTIKYCPQNSVAEKIAMSRNS